MKFLVTGVTGNVGGELYRLLREAGRDVRVVARDAADPSLPTGADIAIADLDQPSTLRAAAAGVQRVFLLGGRRDMRGLLDRFRAEGVEHVVLLTSRSVIDRVPGNAISEMWADSEAALLASGLAWTILRPSGFMSNALRWLPQLATGDVVRAPFAAAAIAAIDTRDIAAVAAAALTDRAHASRALELSGPVALLPETQVEILGRAIGRPLHFEGLSGDEARAELGRLFPQPFVDAQIRFFEGGELDDARVVPTVAEILARPPRTFEQWAADHAAAFRR